MLAGAFLLLQAGCTQKLQWSAVEQMIAADYPNVEHISTDSLALLLARKKGSRPVLLDTRSAEEYSVSHLMDAVHMDPSVQTFNVLDSLSKDTPIVTYCSVGYRSAGVANRLQKAGFTNVLNLKGSIFAWANEGRSVYRSGVKVNQVHPYDRVWGRLLDPKLKTSVD